MSGSTWRCAVRLANPMKFAQMGSPSVEPFAIRPARRLPNTSAVSWAMVHHDGFAFRVDRPVPRSVALGGRDWLRNEFRAVSTQVTHVLRESVHPLFGPYLRRDVEREVRAVQSHGIRVAIVAHGSEVRAFAAHAGRSPVSPYRLPAARPSLQTLEAASARNRALIAHLGLAVFGSTPGVLIDLPQATWLPVAIDCASWRVDTPVLERRVPVVVHIPSRAAIKGTEMADAVLGHLHDDGRIVYRRLVVMHINDSTRAMVRERLGIEPPVLEADADSLDAVMRALLDDPEPGRRLAHDGPAFVDALHDGRASAAALESFLAL